MVRAGAKLFERSCPDAGGTGTMFALGLTFGVTVSVDAGKARRSLVAICPRPCYAATFPTYSCVHLPAVAHPYAAWRCARPGQRVGRVCRRRLRCDARLAPSAVLILLPADGARVTSTRAAIRRDTPNYFAFHFAAQYFFMRSDTAFFAAALIFFTRARNQFLHRSLPGF